MFIKLTQKEADELDRSFGAIPIGIYIGVCVQREYQCVVCKQSYFTEPHTIRKGKKTCNDCSHKRITSKNKLLIKYVRDIISQKELEPLFNDNDYINNKTLLTIRCKCGNEFIASFNSIDRNNTITCGNCKLKRNGKLTSHISLELQKIIEHITNTKWEHNYHIQGLGCVDIANPELKIAIEYDGFYWHRVHKDRTDKDKQKIDKLIKNGWKVLNIKSGGYDLPTEKQLRKVLLNDFQHNTNKRTITMYSWKKAKYKYEN